MDDKPFFFDSISEKSERHANKFPAVQNRDKCLCASHRDSSSLKSITWTFYRFSLSHEIPKLLFSIPAVSLSSQSSLLRNFPNDKHVTIVDWLVSTQFRLNFHCIIKTVEIKLHSWIWKIFKTCKQSSRCIAVSQAITINPRHPIKNPSQRVEKRESESFACDENYPIFVQISFLLQSNPKIVYIFALLTNNFHFVIDFRYFFVIEIKTQHFWQLFYTYWNWNELFTFISDEISLSNGS